MRTIILTTILLISLLQKNHLFTLKSNELGGQADNKQVFNGFGCKGENKSPQLFWENAPTGTKSFAVTIYDENAPTGSGWWHWLIFDIDKNTMQLSSDAGNIKNETAPKIASKVKQISEHLGIAAPAQHPAAVFINIQSLCMLWIQKN